MPTRIIGSDVAARLNNYNLVGLVQSVEYTPNFNAQDILELGNTGKVDTAMEFEATGSMELIDAGALPGLFARMNPTRNASNVPTGYQFASGGAGGKNAYTLTQADMDEMIFDLLLHEKTDQQNFNRSIYIPRAFMTSFNGRAQADGMSTATINFATDFVGGFDSPIHDVKSYFATRTTSVSFTLQDITLPATNWDIAVFYINERRFTKISTEPTYGTFTVGTGVVALTTTESYTIPADALIRCLLYKTSAPSSLFQSVHSGEQGTTARYLKGFQTSLYLAPASVSAPTSAEQWLKVQSCDWSFDFKNTTLKQIAYNSLGSAVYFRGATYPFDVSINATVLESDWLDWRAVLDPTAKPFSGDVTKSMYDLAPASLKSSFNFVMVQYTRAGAKVAEYRFTDMRVDGMGTAIRVSDNNQITWALKGTQYSIIGYNA